MDNLNIITTIPDHILETIFDLLVNFEDKKSFSECCHRFNDVFNRRKHINTVWYRIQGSQNVSDISRDYTKMIWNCNDVKTVPQNVWKNLTPSLTAVRVECDDSLKSRNILDSLPFFKNLTHLDLIVSIYSIRASFLRTRRRRNVKLVEMENLNYLKMNYELFCFLDGHYIDFVTKKLHTLIISHRNSNKFHPWWNHWNRHHLKDFNKLRLLIAKQNDLKTLHLIEGEIHEIFDVPLVVNSQLNDFMLIVDRHFNPNPPQQDNVCDFISSQTQLKLMKCDFYSIEKTDKMRRFNSEKLNLPMKSHRLMITDVNELDPLNLFYVITWCDKYSLEELVQISEEPPNMLTQELELKISGIIRMDQILPLVVSKFPNLTSIDISSDHYPGYDRQDINNNFAALEILQNLKSLTLSRFADKDLITITNPGLKRFTYKAHFNRPLYLTCSFRNFRPQLKQALILETTVSITYASNLTDFIHRHREIQEMNISLNANHGDESYMEVVEFALKNLKNLSLFVIEGFCNFKGLNLWNFLVSWIKEFARPGLVFKNYAIELMKRHDNQVMQKIEGKWQII